MADRTGSDDLIGLLRRVCLEHRAMKALLREDAPHSWRRDVLANCQAVGIQKQIDERLRALHDSPQSSTTTKILAEVLKQTNLDDEPVWSQPLV